MSQVASPPNLVCPRCERTYAGSAGDRCPADAYVLLEPEVHRRFPSDPLLGRVVGTKYLVVDVLGQGGMGAVYRALQMPLGREVALKVIRSAGPPDESLRVRFFREARFLSRMTNRRIAMVLDYGEEPNELLYMVLEYVRGGSLRAALKASGVFEVSRALRVMDHVLEALQEAHAAGLVHRDIKPSNIMLGHGPDGTEEARLLDFGVAKHVGGDEAELTASGAAVGTPAYMSPEQVNQLPLTPAADVYAVTCVLYALLTGRPPYEGSTYEIMRAHVQAPPPELPVDLEVPAGLRAVMDRGLAKAPSDRYADAGALRQALRAMMGVVSETPVPSVPSGASGWDPTPLTPARPLEPELPGATLTGSPVPPARSSEVLRVEAPVPAKQAPSKRRIRLVAALGLGVLASAAAWWTGGERVASAPPVDAEAQTPTTVAPVVAASVVATQPPSFVTATPVSVATRPSTPPSAPRIEAGVAARRANVTLRAPAVQPLATRPSEPAAAVPATTAPPTAAAVAPVATVAPSAAAPSTAAPGAPLIRRPRTFGVAPGSQP